MKKLLILSAVLALSACACWQSEEEQPDPVVYQAAQAKAEGMDCDYFDGKTCYRYTRRTQKIVAPVPVTRYREVSAPVQPCPQYVAAPMPAPMPCPQYVPAPAPMPVAVAAPIVVPTPANACDGCAPKVSQTREPVEVTYKNTTYTTVYKPETTAAVSYEKEPYAAAPVVVSAPVVAPAPAPISVVSVSNPTPVAAASAKAPEFIEYDTEKEILLNVK